MFKYFLLIFAFTSCSDKSENSKSTEQLLTDSLSLKTKDTAVISKRVKLFDNKKPFTIISVANRIEQNSTDIDTLKCSSWTLTDKNIYGVIKNSNAIDGTQWDLEFEVLSCSVFGTIIQDSIEYPFMINAGAYFLINSGDTTVIYGDYKKNHKKLFLSFPQN